ncbi:alpha/beta hydrolase [Paenibacillus thalictri]|uniref:Alpha/beta hydrolase n=1 Tax=Paenibacillus thalictri TaxID=2527873 RepID=A0A4Q9DGY7_9BACL|nr:alpha/beta hydrolase [Paenibacillus thalictri]TBL68601.1 alpha/beta hydrolase [Paenibacillus thalictri]
MSTVLNLKYSETYADARNIDVYVPEKPNGVCLFFIHGGGWEKGNRQQFAEVAAAFCGQGYVCASISYRLAPDSIYPSQIEDARLAMQFLKRRAEEFGFDKQRIVTLGSSAGGYLALILASIDANDALGLTEELTDTDTMPGGVVAYCPVTELSEQFSFVTQYIGGTRAEKPSLYEEAAPVKRNMATSIPYLFVQGDTDDITPLAETQAMSDKIAAAGGTSELVVLPGVGHGFCYGVTTEAQKTSMLEVARFLRKHI